MFKEIFDKKKNPMLEETAKSLKDKKLTNIIFTTLLLFLVASFIQAIVLMIVALIIGFIYGMLDKEYVTGSVLEYGMNLYLTLIPLVVYLLYALKKEKRSPIALGFSKEKPISKYLKGLLAGTLLIAAVTTLLCVCGMANIKFSGTISVVAFILLLLGYVIQGAEEEIIFRGYFMNSLTSKLSVAASVLVSSLLFAAAHLGNDNMTILSFVNLTLFGIMLGVYALRSKSLWGACAFHSIWNFLQGIFLGVEVSGLTLSNVLFKVKLPLKYKFFNGGAFGFEGGFICTICCIVAILLIVFLPEKNKQAVLKKEK